MSLWIGGRAVQNLAPGIVDVLHPAHMELVEQPLIAPTIRIFGRDLAEQKLVGRVLPGQDGCLQLRRVSFDCHDQRIGTSAAG